LFVPTFFILGTLRLLLELSIDLKGECFFSSTGMDKSIIINVCGVHTTVVTALEQDQEATFHEEHTGIQMQVMTQYHFSLTIDPLTILFRSWIN
jgi:hypothetical protein